MLSGSRQAAAGQRSKVNPKAWSVVSITSHSTWTVSELSYHWPVFSLESSILTRWDGFERGCPGLLQSHRSCVIWNPFVLYWLMLCLLTRKRRRKDVRQFLEQLFKSSVEQGADHKSRKHLHSPHICPWRIYLSRLYYLIRRSRTESGGNSLQIQCTRISFSPPMCWSCRQWLCQTQRSRCTSAKPDFRPTVS